MMIYKRLIMLLIGFILVFAGSSYYFNMPPERMTDDIFTIIKGDSLKKVAKNLIRRNLIKNEYFFTLLGIIETDSKVIIGRYKIFKDMTARAILKRLSSGDILRRKITIPEGYNIYEIAELLDENSITDYNEFLRYSNDNEFLESIGIYFPLAEGLLFPDTYIFAEGKDARDVIAVMYYEMKKNLKNIDFKNIEKSGLNIYEILNLASLIEKEAKVPSERNLISAVFHNRLKRGMPLGCDPTVRYAVKKFKERIRYADLKFKSPYNTYIYKGLPPTPICSPGRDSILAALDPERSNFLYFVARNDGSHYFSTNLKEHNRAVDYYQRGLSNGFVDNQKF